MTSTGDIVVDCQYSDSTHDVYLYTLSENSIELKNQLSMDEQATMTLMPTDDFVYSDTGSNSGLTSWNLPTNVSYFHLYIVHVHPQFIFSCAVL